MSIPRGYLSEFATLYEAEAYTNDLLSMLKRDFPDWANARRRLQAHLKFLYELEAGLEAHAAANPREERKPIPGYPYFSVGYKLIASDSPATSSDADPTDH